MNTKPKKLPYKEFVRIYNKVPRLCVDVVIKTKKGIVLSKRSIKPSRGMWHIPGGGVLFGESIKNAIDRVAKEELGIKVKIIKLLGATEFLPPKSRHAHAVSLAFLVKPISGKLQGSRQGKEIKFFKKIPPNTIKEHEAFLKKHKLMK